MRINSWTGLLTVALVTGCGQDNLSDLRDYRDRVLARGTSPIESIPTLSSYESYTYKAKALGLPDPFKGKFKRQELSFVNEADNTTLQKRYALETLAREREELENSEGSPNKKYTLFHGSGKTSAARGDFLQHIAVSKLTHKDKSSINITKGTSAPSSGAHIDPGEVEDPATVSSRRVAEKLYFW